jgi:hypothetical protein
LVRYSELDNEGLPSSVQRVRSQQAEGRVDFLQYVSGEGFAALAYQVTADAADIQLCFRG